MAVSKVILNGTTLIDTTDKTVTSDNMLDGVTALKNDGTTATGSIASKSSSDLTASGATVTAPAGFYSAAASKSVSTTTHPNPTASINSTTGVVTASHAQTTGYVSAGTTTGTLELPTQAAKTVTPTESEQTAVAAGKYTTGTVKVGAISSTYVGSGIDQNDSTDLTASGATVTAPAGYYAESASKSVASGTAGTPTATKGAVSNNSVSVTPSVTNSTGYITGGTKNGTAVTVSASELVSGTKSITASGETDVTNYEKASVAAGSAATPATTITANPTISVSAAGLITASVSGSQNITPSVSAGYVSSGTAGTVSVSGSKTQQLTAKAATTYYPSTTDQTIDSGQYLTGAQSIKAVTTTNLTAENIAEGVTVEVGDSADSDRILSITGTHQGGTTPTGVKYIYTDIDGDGAWDVSGYQYCSVDYAAVPDEKMRLWIKLNSDDLSFTFTVAVATNLSYRTNGLIDWGDGSSYTEWDYDHKTNTHTYSEAGIYVVELWRTGGADAFSGVNPFEPAEKPKIIAIDIFLKNYPTNTITLTALENLESVRYSSQQTTVGSITNNPKLTTLVLPDSANNISNMNGNSALKYLIIPASVTSISSSAFVYCSSMEEYHVLPTTPPTLGTNAFGTLPANCIIYVPNGCLEAYQTATNWADYATKMQEEP